MIKTLGAVAAMTLSLALTNPAKAQQQAPPSPPPGPKESVAVLGPISGSMVHGVVVLTQFDGYVQVTGKIEGLKPGEHGFHIHKFGDLRSPDGMSAGGHFDGPQGHKHGSPEAPEHHLGDLGNITANSEGVAEIDAKAEGVRLPQIMGRSIVVHADPDDMKTQPAGNSGPRIGMGVIGLGEVKPPPAAAGSK
jgi:superoxide dismutase, Cu-Zn family